MSDTAAVVVAVLGTIGTISAGALTAVIQMWKSRRAGVKNQDVQNESKKADPVAGFDRLTEHMASEIGRLQEEKAASVREVNRLDELVEHERSLRWKAIQLARSLYAWIAQRVPGSTPPRVPDELAPYINLSRKDKDE